MFNFVFVYRQFTERSKSLSSAIANYHEQAGTLYRSLDKEITNKFPCPGTLGPKKQKRDCCGPAVITLTFTESVICTDVC